MTMDDTTRTELEAAAFRRLTALLRRSDVQNIDLMTLAGFCRNCLSNWIEDAARERGLSVSKAEAREHVYGMPYEQWKTLHQTDATPEQATRFAQAAHTPDIPRPHSPDAVDPASRKADC